MPLALRRLLIRLPDSIRWALHGRIPRREVIGVPECPLMYRWTFADNARFKLFIHRFIPKTIDRDPHDHPRSFVTFVLRGSYVDISTDVRDYVRAPAIRFRRAQHAHRVEAGPRGAWTLCIMGPVRRPWGFLRDGNWWPWKKYEEVFGMAMRCDDD